MGTWLLPFCSDQLGSETGLLSLATHRYWPTRMANIPSSQTREAKSEQLSNLALSHTAGSGRSKTHQPHAILDFHLHRKAIHQGSGIQMGPREGSLTGWSEILAAGVRPANETPAPSSSAPPSGDAASLLLTTIARGVCGVQSKQTEGVPWDRGCCGRHLGLTVFRGCSSMFLGAAPSCRVGLGIHVKPAVADDLSTSPESSWTPVLCSPRLHVTPCFTWGHEK